jgi:hypothetical protein
LQHGSHWHQTVACTAQTLGRAAIPLTWQTQAVMKIPTDTAPPRTGDVAAVPYVGASRRTH